jgi:hypothetical protein
LSEGRAGALPGGFREFDRFDACPRRSRAVRAPGPRGADQGTEERDSVPSLRVVSVHVKGGPMAKGIEKSRKDNKPKLSTKEKQKRKKEKKAGK